MFHPMTTRVGQPRTWCPSFGAGHQTLPGVAVVTPRKPPNIESLSLHRSSTHIHSYSPNQATTCSAVQHGIWRNGFRILCTTRLAFLTLLEDLPMFSYIDRRCDNQHITDPAKKPATLPPSYLWDRSSKPCNLADHLAFVTWALQRKAAPVPPWPCSEYLCCPSNV